MTLIRAAEVDGYRQDVRLAGGRVVEIGDIRPMADEDVIDARGGALLPGLHDHHLHLLAMAAAAASIDVSGGLLPLVGQPGAGWLRAVGAGDAVDQRALDAVVAQRPVRAQHASGALWTVNSVGARLLDLDGSEFSGIERDGRGLATGRIWRGDRWIAERVGRREPDLDAVIRRLAGFGITGVTDATPDLDRESVDLLSSVPQRVRLLGDPDGSAPWKIVLADHQLPAAEDLAWRIRVLRPRAVAVHCVSREAYLLLAAVLNDVGSSPGDRIEHGALLPGELLGRVPATVVTQPGFIRTRGDRYLVTVDPRDQGDLYRWRTLLAAGVAVAASSDAPYGPDDPWELIAAAADRLTESGVLLGGPERVATATALDAFLTPLDDPGGAPRRVHEGVQADLVLLHVPLRAALAEPRSDLVAATWIAGEAQTR